MLGISNDAWLASGTIVGAIGMIGIPIGGWAMSVVRAKHVAELKSVSDACGVAIEKAKTECAASIKDVENSFANIQKQEDLTVASLKAAWVVLDDLRINGVRKADQDRMRDEFRADMKSLGDRLEAAITALRDDIHGRKRDS